MMSAKFWDLGSSSTCHAAPLPLISSLDLSAFPWTYRIYQLTKVLNQHCLVQLLVNNLDINASVRCKIETILYAYFTGQKMLRCAPHNTIQCKN